MLLDDVLYDGEAKPCATALARAAFIYTVEALEDAGQVCFRDTAAVVLHNALHARIEGGNADCDGRGAAGVLGGVVQEVFQNLSNAQGIQAHNIVPRFGNDGEGERGIQPCAEIIADFLCEIGQRILFEVKRVYCCFKAGQSE